LWGINFGDMNGDGFGDIVTRATENASSYYEMLVLYGKTELGVLPAEISEPDLTISRSSTAVIVGEWNLGRAFESLYPVGEIDGDGFLEFAGFKWAFDHTVSEPVSTYGFSIVCDDLGTGVVTYEDAIDFTFVSGFPVSDYENTEKLTAIRGTGDLTGDGIDDLFFETDYSYGTNPGRLFKVDGRTEWPELFDVAEVMPSQILDGYQFYRTIADIDDDGVNEVLFSGTASGSAGGKKVVLSASGQEIDITNWVMQWDAYPPIY